MSKKTARPLTHPTAPISLAMSQVRESRFNPRKTFNSQSLEEMAESIRTHGLLQPISVRHLHDEEGIHEFDFEIIDGGRRFRAAQMAGLLEVPVVVVSANESKARELQLVANIQRVDLTPMEEARAFDEMLSLGHTQATIASRACKSLDFVFGRLSLLNLCPDARERFGPDGPLTLGHARVLADLSHGDQQTLMIQAIECAALLDGTTIETFPPVAKFREIAKRLFAPAPEPELPVADHEAPESDPQPEPSPTDEPQEEVTASDAGRRLREAREDAKEADVWNKAWPQIKQETEAAIDNATPDVLVPAIMLSLGRELEVVPVFGSAYAAMRFLAYRVMLDKVPDRRCFIPIAELLGVDTAKALRSEAKKRGRKA